MTDHSSAESPAERKRRLARERQRKHRALENAGKVRSVVETDEAHTGWALADDALIDPNKADDPKEIADGLRRLVDRWLARKLDEVSVT